RRVAEAGGDEARLPGAEHGQSHEQAQQARWRRAPARRGGGALAGHGVERSVGSALLPLAGHPLLPSRVTGAARREGLPPTSATPRGASVSDRADYSKHSDDELREGIERAEEQEPRIAEESSEEALEAEREQRAAMEDELRKRSG